MALPYWMGSMWVIHFHVSLLIFSSMEGEKMQVKELILSIQTDRSQIEWPIVIEIN